MSAQHRQLRAADKALLRRRRTFSEKQLRRLASQFSNAQHAKHFSKLAIYTSGSYGRLEASKFSDIDLFFVLDAQKDSLDEFNVPEIRLMSEVIDIGYSMNFPKFSNDGEFLRIIFSNEMLDKLGSPSDDYENHFTARMLLLLESRSLYGDSTYEKLLKKIIKSYFRDYPKHPDDFRPTFLINDILRFWKTLCLNYEHKRNHESSRAKIKHKVRNFKLGFSRLLTCFATVAALSAFKRTITPNSVFNICKMTPVERLQFVANVRPDLIDDINQALTLYGWFLRKTELSQLALEKYMSTQRNRKEAFGKSRKFGNKIYLILKGLDSSHDHMRYLVV